MTSEDIIKAVEISTGITYEGMKYKRPIKVLFARYICIVMMHEEGYSVSKIADKMYGHRTTIYSTIKVINNLLETNATFKKMYLDCIAKLTEMEDAA